MSRCRSPTTAFRSRSAHWTAYAPHERAARVVVRRACGAVRRGQQLDSDMALSWDALVDSRRAPQVRALRRGSLLQGVDHVQVAVGVRDADPLLVELAHGGLGDLVNNAETLGHLTVGPPLVEVSC